MINKRRYRRFNIRAKIIENINNNIIEYIIMIIMLLIGITLGTFYVKNIGENGQQEILKYIEDFFTKIQSNSSINMNSLLKNSIQNNLISVILLWIAGLSVIGMPILYLIVVFKGFTLGYTISAVISCIGTADGIKFILSAMLLQNIIIIPSILLLSVSGIKLYKSIIKDRRRENIKLEILRYSIITIIVAIINIFASIIETYISANLFSMLFIK